MLSAFFFDKENPKFNNQRPGIWHFGAALLTIGYLLFGLVLIGVKGLSVGGFIFASLCTLWLLVGLASRAITFPLVLLLPLVYFLYLAVTGLQIQPYPVEYILRMITIWLSAISLAAFIYNGLSLKLIIGGFIVVFLANMAAIYVGYDGALINKQDLDLQSIETVEIQRYTGLAGQANLLLSLIFTLPFLVFALKKRVNVLVFIALALVGIGITFITGSRSGIVFSTLFILSGSLLLVSRGPFRSLIIASGLVMSIMAAVFFTDNLALSKIENSALGDQVLVQRVFQKLDATEKDSRDVYKTEFWPIFNQKPLIGHGPGAYATATGYGVYAHNNFAEIAVNGGILGLLLYYSMYFAVGFGIINSLKKNLFLLAPLLFLIAADNWYVTYVSRALVLCLCIILMASYTAGSKKTGKSRSRRRRRRVSVDQAV